MDSKKHLLEGMSLPAYLQYPVRRIPRYNLLFKELQKNSVDLVDSTNCDKVIGGTLSLTKISLKFYRFK